MCLTTKRVLLRRWLPTDLEPFARLNADPHTMRFFPNTLTTTESAEMISRIENAIEERGFGLWAAEHLGTGQFMGFVGLSVPRFESHFTPCVEIGWRLAHEFWGQGLAPEAATAVREYAHKELDISEVVSFCATDNLPSRRVMEKIGLTRNSSDDFEHPGLEPGHRLRAHVLYRGRG